MANDFEDLVETFSFLDSWEDRYRHIIEIGKAMPALDAAFCVADYKVDGCASQVWLRMRVDDEWQLHFDGASDALIVSGLIEVLRMLYNGVNMEDVLAINAADQLARLGLDAHLSAQRSNGLRAMVERIRGFAVDNKGKDMTLKTEAEAEKEARKVRSRESYERVLGVYNKLEKLNELGESLHWYFNSIPDFEDCADNGHILNIIIFYVCMRIERAKRITLYYHRIIHRNETKEKAGKAIKNLRLHAGRFKQEYNKLIETPINNEALKLKKNTKNVRNAVIHGDDINVAAAKTQTIADIEKEIKKKEDAIADLFEHAIKLNREVLRISKFQPFTDLSVLASGIKTDDYKKKQKS